MDTAQQTFDNFCEGLRALTTASFSIAQAIGVKQGNALTYPETVAELAKNAATEESTDGEPGDGQCAIGIRPDGFRYTTRSGLAFEVDVRPREWDAHLEKFVGGTVTFYVSHPEGTFWDTSSLGRALEKEGFDVPWKGSPAHLDTTARFKIAALRKAGVERGDQSQELTYENHTFDFGVIEPGKIGAQVTNNLGQAEGGRTFEDPEEFADWVSRDREPATW